MVVTENGEAAKAEYRRFKIKWHPETPNDFAMMNEVLMRRFRAYLDGQEKFQKLPDLIMIDGGKGQLGAALKARDDLGLTVPMVGLAKRHELIYLPILGESLVAPEDKWVYHPDSGHEDEASRLNEDRPPTGPLAPKGSGISPTYTFREIELPLNSPGLMLLRKLRDEAHRFAITFHRKIRDKRMNGSALEEIPGVGPRRKRLLLRTFGSLEGIRRATVDEVAAVPTMTKVLADKVKEYLSEA